MQSIVNIDMPSYAQFRRRGLTALTAGHFVSDFYATFLPALIPVLIAEKGLSLTASGILVLVFSIAANVLQPLFGYLVDKSGYTSLLLWSLPLSAFFICTVNFAPDYYWLVFLVTLSGIGNSLFHPIASSMTNKITIQHNPGLSLSIFVGGGNFGFAIAPAVVAFWLSTYGLPALPWLMAPGLVMALFLYRTKLHCLQLVRKTANTSTDKVTWYRQPGIWLLNIAMGMRSWTQIALTTFLPVYMIQQLAYDPLTASSYLTFFLIGGACGGLTGGYFSDKIGYKRCVTLSLVLALLCYGLLCYLISINHVLFPLFLFLTGALLQASMPSSIVWAQILLPQNRSLASGMMLGLSNGLGGIGAAGSGWFADLYGLPLMLLVTILPVFFACLLTLQTPEANFAQPSN